MLFEGLYAAQLTRGAADARPARARGRRHSRWRLFVPGDPNTVLQALGLAGHLDRKFTRCTSLVACLDCIVAKGILWFQAFGRQSLCTGDLSSPTSTGTAETELGALAGRSLGDNCCRQFIAKQETTRARPGRSSALDGKCNASSNPKKMKRQHV